MEFESLEYYITALFVGLLGVLARFCIEPPRTSVIGFFRALGAGLIVSLAAGELCLHRGYNSHMTFLIVGGSAFLADFILRGFLLAGKKLIQKKLESLT